MSQTCSHSIIDPRGVRFRKIIGHQIKLQSLKEKSQRCCKAGTESTFHEHFHVICYNRSCPFDCFHNDQDWLVVWNIKTDWWFGTFFIFPYIGNNHPNWLKIFQRGRSTTNQKSFPVSYFVVFAMICSSCGECGIPTIPKCLDQGLHWVAWIY